MVLAVRVVVVIALLPATPEVEFEIVELQAALL
jgi:hypothetical protein